MNAVIFDLAGEVLDHTVFDSNERPCGKVDDIEIEGSVGQPLRVNSILIGPGGWAARLPRLIGPMVMHAFGAGVTVVPWEQIDEISPKVKLRVTAETLGLDKSEKKAAQLLARFLRL